MFQLLTLAGIGLVLLVQTIQSFQLQPRQGYSLVVLVLSGIAVALTLVVLLWKPLTQIVAHPSLLVPLGLLVICEALLGWVAAFPPLRALFVPFAKLEFARLTFALSIGFVLMIIANVLYAAWVTKQVLNVALLGNGDLLAGIWGMRWIGHVFLVLLIGWSVLFAGMAVAMLFATASVFFAAMLLGGFTLIWNLLTAGMLPAVFDPRRGFPAALTGAFQASLAGLGRWWYVVFAQLLLLGFATLVHVSFTKTTTQQRGGMTQTNTEHVSRTNWGVNGFWVGGYENDSRWHTAVMGAADAPRLAPVSTLLALLYGVLAIAVKLKIARGLYPAGLPAMEGPAEAYDPYQPQPPPRGW
jgi:hypothetical protein